MASSVGIVGGGMLGLSLAWRLRLRGHAVHLFEARPGFGGMADAWSLGDVTWDRHYHVTLKSDLVLRALLDELDLTPRMTWQKTQTGFFAGGRYHSMSNALEFLRFPPLTFLSKVRLGATILGASRRRDWRHLERQPVSTWLRRWSGDETFETVWRPLLRAKVGDDYERASAAFIWSIIARMYAARRAGIEEELFGYVDGGYGTTLDRLVEALSARGVSLNSGTAVQRVTSLGQRSGVVVALSDGQQHTFDRVVVTTAAPITACLCPQLTDLERFRLEHTPYKGIVCASLLLRRALTPYYITNIIDPGIPFTGVIEMTALVDKAQLGGHHLVYLPKYLDATDPLFHTPDEVIERDWVAVLRRMVPDLTPDDVLAFRVSRVKYVYPLPIVEFSKYRPETRSSASGLYIANPSQIVNGTLNVNETVQLANSVAEIVCQDAGGAL